MSANIKNLSIRMPETEHWRASLAAAAKGESLNEFVCRAIAIAVEEPLRDLHSELGAQGYEYRPKGEGA